MARPRKKVPAGVKTNSNFVYPDEKKMFGVQVDQNTVLYFHSEEKRERKIEKLIKDRKPFQQLILKRINPNVK